MIIIDSYHLPWKECILSPKKAGFPPITTSASAAPTRQGNMGYSPTNKNDSAADMHSQRLTTSPIYIVNSNDLGPASLRLSLYRVFC